MKRRFSRLFLRVLCLALVFGMASGWRARAQEDLSGRLGVVIRHGDALCAYLAVPAPPPASRLEVVVSGATQMLAAASLNGGSSTCHDEITPPMKAFRLDLTSGTIPPAAAIGIVGNANLSHVGHALEWRSGSAPVTFSSCTSADGVHLGAWQQGRRVWHAYIYVGQDLTPNCSQAQAQP